MTKGLSLSLEHEARVNGDLAKLKPTFAHRVSIQAHCSGLDESQKLHAEMHSARNAIAEAACRQERLGSFRERYLTARVDNYPWPTTAHRATSTQVRSPGGYPLRSPRKVCSASFILLFSFFRSSHVVSKGNRVRTDLTSFDPCELLRRSTELPLFSFRSFPHEVPTAGDKLRKPRVLFAIIERLEARDARENALWRSAARDPIARHQRDFASCVFASARVLRVLLNANLSQIIVSLRLLSRLCVSGRSRRGIREVRGAACRAFVYICTRATAAFGTNARSTTFFQVLFTRFYSLRVRPFALRVANISRLCTTLRRAVLRA